MGAFLFRYSEVVYSKPVEFVKRARIMGFKDSCTGEKVSREDFAHTLVMAAVANLIDLNALSLKWAEVKGWGPFKKKGFFLTREEGKIERGLEAVLLNSLGEDGSFLSDALSRIIGGESSDPHTDIIGIVERELAQAGKGSFEGRIRKKFKFNCEEPQKERITKVTSSIEMVRRTFPKLEKEIRNSLNSLIKRLGSDMDDFD